MFSETEITLVRALAANAVEQALLTHTLPAPLAQRSNPELAEILVELRHIRRSQHALGRAVAALHTQGEEILMISKELQDVLDAIDNETNTVAKEVADLRGQISTGMTQTDVDGVTARLKGIETRLEGVAADPENPVPVVAPTTGTADGTGSPS